MVAKTRAGAAKRRRPFDAEAYLQSTGPARKVVKHRRGEEVFAQGDPATDVRYLQKGVIKISVLSRIGKEAVIAMLSPGDFFGEGALAGQTVRIETATVAGTEQRTHHREGSDGSAAPRRAAVCRPVPLTYAGPEHAHRGGSRRSAFQLQRKSGSLARSCCWRGTARPIPSERCRRSRRRRSRK